MRQTKLLFLLLLALFMSATGAYAQTVGTHSSPLTALPTRLRKRTHYGYVRAFLGVLLHSLNAASANSYCETTEE